MAVTGNLPGYLLPLVPPPFFVGAPCRTRPLLIWMWGGESSGVADSCGGVVGAMGGTPSWIRWCGP